MADKGSASVMCEPIRCIATVRHQWPGVLSKSVTELGAHNADPYNCQCSLGSCESNRWDVGEASQRMGIAQLANGAPKAPVAMASGFPN
jgi:hypothetical protein